MHVTMFYMAVDAYSLHSSRGVHDFYTTNTQCNKTWLDTMYFAAFVCVVPPAVRAPLTVNIVCEEQTPSQNRIAAQAPPNPPCFELPCGELEVESNSFGPLGIDPSLLQ